MIRKKILITYANSTLLSIAIGAFLNSFFQLHINSILIIVAAFFFSSCIMLLDSYKKNVISYLTILGIIIAGIIISAVFKFSYADVIRRVIEWCKTYDRDIIHYDRWCGFATMAGILFLCCITTYICHKYNKTKYILAALFLILLIIACINKLYVPKITVGIILVYSMVILVEICGGKLHKNSNVVDNSIATIYLAPICLLIAILAVSLPSNVNPIQWNGIKNFIHTVKEQGSMLITEIQFYLSNSSGEFELSYTEYSEDSDSELGGEVKIKNKNTLSIFTDNKSTSRGYLIGSISDSYTGRKWEKVKSNHKYEQEDYYLDFFELLLCFTKAEQEGITLTNIVQKRNFKIMFKDIKTKSIFYPLKSFDIYFDKPNKYVETNQGALLFKKAKGNGTVYKAEYYELNLNDESFKNILRNAGNQDVVVTENNLRKTADSIFYSGLSKVNFNVLLQELTIRTEEIRKRYTTLPDDLPNRVKKLAYEVTKDYDNDYDKLKAIEAYLNQMTYTTKIGRTPEEEDFVDYFLFEQQTGYCSYFASAMGVMARCVGIPTRYVEGYVVDYNDRPKAHTYMVYSQSAHSWIDAYIEGVGWIPFEPTPGFYDGRYIRWKEKSETGNPSSNMPNGYMQPTPPIHESIDTYDIEINGTNRLTLQEYIFAACSVILCILLLFASIVWVYYKLMERKYCRRYRNSSQKEQLTMKLGEILHYVTREGYKLPSNETLYSYAKRIGKNIEFGNVSFLTIVLIYMRTRYGEKDVKESDLTIVIKFSRDFEKYLYLKLGRRKMFFDRFMFLHHI